MADKIKATLQGRPSHTNKSTIDTTRACVGGQSQSDALIPASALTAALARLVHTPLAVQPTILKRVANLQLGLGYAQNFVYPIGGYAHFWAAPLDTSANAVSCQPDIGHRSLWECAPLPYTPDNSRSFSRCSEVSNGQRNFAFADLIQVFGSSLACLRCLRFISACIEVIINCEVLSPSSLTDSIDSTISCGTRDFRDCDFAFFVPVAIAEPSYYWWATVYTVIYQNKALTWATLENYSGPHLDSFMVQKQRSPAGGCNTRRASYHNVNEAYIMAESQSTQTRLKFTWRFLAVPAIAPDAKPIVLYTNATSEQDARDNCPGWLLFFAARLPVQEVRHA